MAILYDDYKKEWQQAARNNPKKFNVEDSSVDARTNLKNKTLNHNEALKKYQDAYSKSLKREFEQKGITSLMPIKKENNPILTKDSKAFRNDSIVLPNLKKVNREIETERQKANRALNELRYAKYQYNADKVNNEKTSFWDKTGGTVVRGVSDLFSGFTAGENKYIDDEGRRYNLPTYNQLKQEKVSKDYSTKHGKFIGDVAYNTSKILASSAMNIVAPGSGTTLYWSDMFLDNLEKTKNDGYDTASSIAYSAIGTGFEYLTGKFLGSATKKLTGGKSSTLEKGLSDALSKVISNKKIVNILSNAGSEGAEEFFQEYLDNLNKLIVLDKKQPLSAIKDVVLDGTILRDALYSAAVGAVTGGLLNFNDGIDETRNVNDIFKEQLELSKENVTDKNTIKKIDTVLSYINNNNNKTDIDNIKSEINAYKMLKEQSNLNEQQAAELKGLREQLRNLEKTNKNTTNNISENTKIDNVLPTVEDIVNQEKADKGGLNLPTVNNESVSSESLLKEKQNEIIQKSNPVNDDYHTWIRSTDDIKTFEEALNDNDWIDYKGQAFDESYPYSIAESALETGKITVYSSFPIKQGVFVSPSKMKAQSYSETGKIYSKEVNLTDVAWIDPTQGQYAKISSNMLPVLDTTGINNANKAMMPIDSSQIRQVKGNIPINQELLNKYSTAREIFDNESNNFDGKVNVKSNIPELNNIDIFSMKSKEIKELAYGIFKKYNSKSIFENDGNKITVSKSGINESIEKIFNNKVQRNLLKEHLQVFSDLGDIIENATLVNQTREIKNRSNINSWNYYFDGLNINNELYHLEFDVRSLDTGENQYRVQRLQKKQTTHSGDVSNNTKILPAFEQFAFSNGNIPQLDNNVKSSVLPTINNTQNVENNTNKILNPNEISKLTKEDTNTTPILPMRKKTNKVNDGDSHFAKNIENKVGMLNEEQKASILSKKDVEFYDKVTNKESLDKAFKKINDGGSSETLRWVKQDSKDASAVDVAEGWILLKQYADNGDYDSMVEVAKKMREIGTSAGQTVQAFNIMERMTPEGMVKYAQSELSEAYDRMVKNKTKEWIDKYREDFDLKPDEVKFIMDTMQEVQNMEDGYEKRVKLAEIQKLMTDKLPPEKGAKIKSWMRISMLFNPKTQVRNVAGNALIMPVNSFADLFSSYADKLIAKKTGVRTTGNTNIKAMLKGVKKGVYEATTDYRKGINTKDMEGNRFEISNGKSFSEKNLIGKALNRTESLLNYVMDLGDRGFSEAAFENSLQNQMVLNNTTEITQEMIDIAHQEALSRTWNDNNNYTRFVLGVRKGLNKLNVNGYGLGDALIPFAKTPANLTKAIVDYSPAGLVSTINKGINLKRSLTNGQYTATMQHEFVQSLGKATAGTMLYVLGIALAKAGITSGESDDDKDTANFLKNTLGVSSYSIKIGGKSFTYDWAQPLAAPLSITANVVNSKSNDFKALLEGIVGSLDTAGSILLEQSFLQSINDVLNDNDGIVSGIINEVLQLPARAVPTFSKQIADLVDGTQRTSFEYGKPIQTALNSIKAKIPFVSKTLNPAVDALGREIQKYGGKNNLFNVFLNPANVNTENISTSAKEIYRLYKETGEKDVMPRVAPYYINQKGEKIMMTGKTRVEYQKASGKIIEDNIKELLSDKTYSNMSDSDKADVIKDIVNYSYNIAKKEVLGLELSNAYQKAYEYSEIGNIGDYYTFKESIDNTDKDTKKASITKFLIDSDLNNKQLAYLYGGYYSSDKVLNALVQSNVPIKEFIKFNSETFENDYYNNGKIVPNSRRNKVIKYINSLNLSVPQKAMLIKMEYNSFKKYDNQIVKYVNGIDCSAYDKKVILKIAGFSNYDKEIINAINSQNISIEEKTKELQKLGFKVRNGKVYAK